MPHHGCTGNLRARPRWQDPQEVDRCRRLGLGRQQAAARAAARPAEVVSPAAVRVLGIETSCDETSAAVVSGAPHALSLDSLVILSQDVHRLFGGVVPEIASRQHLTGIVPAVNAALRDANVGIRDLDAIAVTYAPGLVGALLVGTSYAKALGFTHDVPVVPVPSKRTHARMP
ncbi:MAG: hypothetical protein EBV77_06810 [Gemmatimonadaceae bacterium]|nr:hypothetical protein [Gemmatimonadaceae bacterium]